MPSDDGRPASIHGYDCGHSFPAGNCDDLPPVITFPRDAVLERVHLQAALHASDEIIDKLDLPFFTVGRRGVRYIVDTVAQEHQPAAGQGLSGRHLGFDSSAWVRPPLPNPQ